MAQVHATADRAPNRRGTRAHPTYVVDRPRLRSGRVAHTSMAADENRGTPPAKHRLASQINHLLDGQQLGQLAAAKRLGISQSKVSAIRNYKLHGISLERLMQILVALDQRVTIVVRPRAASPAEVMSVVL